MASMNVAFDCNFRETHPESGDKVLGEKATSQRATSMDPRDVDPQAITDFQLSKSMKRRDYQPCEYSGHLCMSDLSKGIIVLNHAIGGISSRIAFADLIVESRSRFIPWSGV